MGPWMPSMTGLPLGPTEFSWVLIRSSRVVRAQNRLPGKTAMFLVTPTIEGTWRLNGCDNCVRPSSGWFPPPSDPLSRRLESSGIDSSRNQQLTPASVASAKRRPAEHQFVKPLSLLI